MNQLLVANDGEVNLALVCNPYQPELAMLGNRVALCQAKWVLDHPEYATFYQLMRENDWYVILDWTHPTGEARDQIRTADFSEYVHAIELIRPNEIVIPDMFQEHHGTIAMAGEFLSKYRDALQDNTLPKGVPRMMFVPQGENGAEWLSCLSILSTNHKDDFDVIGMPKWLDREWNKADHTPRRYMLDALHASSRIPFGTMIHMLGVATGAAEMFYHPRIRSWDTSLPLAAAQAGMYLEDGVHVKYELMTTTADTIDSFHDLRRLFANIMTVQSLLRE